MKHRMLYKSFAIFRHTLKITLPASDLSSLNSVGRRTDCSFRGSVRLAQSDRPGLCEIAYQAIRRRSAAESRSATSSTKVTNGSKETVRYWNRFIAVSNAKPIPPAPTKPSTREELKMLCQQIKEGFDIAEGR